MPEWGFLLCWLCCESVHLLFFVETEACARGVAEWFHVWHGKGAMVFLQVGENFTQPRSAGRGRAHIGTWGLMSLFGVPRHHLVGEAQQIRDVGVHAQLAACMQRDWWLWR